MARPILGQLRRQSGRLRSNASFGDVLGDFYDVVRRAKSEAWDSLRGGARCVMDERMAAEVLDRFADELEGVTTADRPELPEHLAQQAVSRRPESLDAALTGLHLSPHPPLVVALEGKTEMTLFPKVLAQLGITMDPSWMKFVEFEGTKDLSLLARFAAEPQLEPITVTSLCSTTRSLASLFSLTPRTSSQRRRSGKQRKRWTQSRGGCRRPPARAPHPGARIVEILTWGQYPFEFAHFNDHQIADRLYSSLRRGTWVDDRA